MATLRFPEPPEQKLPTEIPLIWPLSYRFNPIQRNRIVGSLMGLAVGDALGASVEFRPHHYLVQHPVTNMMSGGTWGLKAGQWTDDTAMALCLASSLITHRRFNPYDQLVRYKWWYKHGYLSATGQCFDLGSATRKVLEQFIYYQQQIRSKFHLPNDYDIDHVPMNIVRQMKFNVNLGRPDAKGNGALMRIAPIALFYHQNPRKAIELAGESARLTHGHPAAIDACRYYTALIVGAIHGISKENLLHEHFLGTHREWFKGAPLNPEILRVVQGSYKRLRGYDDGIRGHGDAVHSIEAALWAFWSTDSFQKGALNAVNLGDDTDTVAAIYGQLAGAYYGMNHIPIHWRQQLYAAPLIECIGQWLQVLNTDRSIPHTRTHQMTTAKYYGGLTFGQNHRFR